MRAFRLGTMFALGAIWILAQGTEGTISGKILDADGAAVANTPVQITNTATKAVYKATALANGEYSLKGLPAGNYDLSVAASAFVFEPYERKNIALAAGQSLHFDIKL